MSDSWMSIGGSLPLRVPRGTGMHELGTEPCLGTGIKWTAEESKDALDGPVADILNDVAGTRIVAEAFELLEESDFRTGRIDAFALRVPARSYRLGEAIGEAYLSAWRDCTFPWPMSRDSRRPSASLPGPDLVGFKTEAGSHYLVFGEVKTSKQSRYPPSVMWGRDGFLQQLKGLRTDRALHHHLIRYLLLRCTGQARERLTAAVRRYRANFTDCRFFGVLIRDVPPDGRDLRHAVSRLGADCPDPTRVEFIAVYLPPGRLDPVAGDSTPVAGTA